MVRKILIIIIKIGIVVISMFVSLLVFIEVRPIYTDTLYPNAYAKLFIKGDEKIVNAYKGEICLDTDIVSRTYKWKNITSTYPFRLNNKKSPNSLDCFTALAGKYGNYKEYIVRLKTDQKTINYIIKAHNRPEVWFYGIANSTDIEEMYPKVTIKINNEGYDVVTSDAGYYSYSDNFEMSRNFCLYGATHLESIILEGEYKGIRSVADIVFNDLDTGEQYTCDEVIMSDTLGEFYKMQGISSIICSAIPLVDGDNRFLISAIDKLGRKVYWSFILTKYSNDIFQSRLKLTVSCNINCPASMFIRL